MHSSPLPDRVDGWFAVALATDVPVGAIHPCRLQGEDLVVIRTASGALAAYEAHCPHLGASFAAQGKVVGETLQCGAHGLCFSVDGAGPRRMRARSLPAQEWLGVVMVWRHRENVEPWPLPVVRTEGWGAPTHDRFRLRGHPQEVIENGVDTAHFSWIHGFAAGERTSALTREGHHLHLSSRFDAPAKVAGQSKRQVTIAFEFDAYGLGIAVIASDSEAIGLRSVTIVLPTPLGDGDLAIRLVTLVADPGAIAKSVPGLGVLIPHIVGAPLVRELFRRAAVFDFQKDIVYWGSKRYLPKPALTAEDGPIAAYRRWARQFYGEQGAEGTGEGATAGALTADGAGALEDVGEGLAVGA